MKNEWKTVVKDTICRLSKQKNTPTVSRQQIIKHPAMESILNAPPRDGRTPKQTLSYVLQQLRGEGFIEFLGYGKYRLRK